MVGSFAPILNAVSGKTEHVYIFEQNGSAGSNIISDGHIPVLLPTCDIVIIAATSLINHTIEEILPCCRSAREVCIVGPSTPLALDVFQKYNVNLLAGTIVTDAQRLLEIISQGGGTMSMKPATKHALVSL